MTDSFQKKIQKIIGTDLYNHLEKLAEKEVARIMSEPITDAQGEKIYYYPFQLPKLHEVCENFEGLGLKICPLDIFNVIFKTKLIRATQSEDEYLQRVGKSWPGPLWRERVSPVDEVLTTHFNKIEKDQKERTLLSQVSFFSPSEASDRIQKFFEELFQKLEFPFLCFFEGDHLLEKHKQLEPGLKEYSYKDAVRYFSAPSIGFTTFGSRDYCYWYSLAWLKTFLNLLRVVGFIHPGQMEFNGDVSIIAPISPVFLNEHSSGTYRWHEDEKEPWLRVPDGCLFLSFGYRGLQRMWLDSRTFGYIDEFFQKYKFILAKLKNPWESVYIRDIAPTLEILSSATQMPDIGSKLLLLYCSLEHLFVPKGITRDNKKYIVGAINALQPNMLSWFKHLYDLRCDYAHKGFVLKDGNTLKLIKESMNCVMTLLLAKISV
jgi:hypothetical protein